MRKYEGIRHIKDDVFEINFRPFRGAKRIQRRIKAVSKQDASIKRSELLVEALKIKNPEAEQRGSLSFDEYGQFLKEMLQLMV